jgi:hypothetical protein
VSVKLERDHRGRKRYRVSRYWPDGSRFRRFMPNLKKARHVDAKIHAAICDGTWPRLKARLELGQGRSVNVAEYVLIYRDEYCKPRNRSWKRKWSVRTTETYYAKYSPHSAARRVLVLLQGRSQKGEAQPRSDEVEGVHGKPEAFPGVSTFIHPNLTVHGQLREVLY